MKMIKVFGFLSTIIIVIILVLYFIPWTDKINTTLQGVQYRIGDKNYEEKISIKIDGEYKNFLFKNDTFHGTISIDKYDFTSNGSSVSLQLGNGNAFLIYMNVVDGKPIQNPLGIIYCTPQFKKLVICVSEPLDKNSYVWNKNNGLFISAPSSSRSQAIDAAKALVEKDMAESFE